ncbi:MAG: methyltransferase domain-containing protein [Balneolaceae bacterium]|nr:MAG: methyltransferase domain-containing protein [Balneolaceae bacterium]
MNCCGHCRDAGDFFNERTARRELKRYLRRGPEKPTRLLIEAISGEEVTGKTLLDIGGGIGAIQFELFKKDLSHSLNVDASTAYQSVSKEEASNRGVKEKAEYLFGDFTDLASDLPKNDIVTLDKVICCYPDFQKLLQLSLQKCGRVYGLVYPRVNGFTKIGFSLINLWFRIRGSEFRIYLHSPKTVDEIIRENGFQKRSYKTTILWQVVVYERI